MQIIKKKLNINIQRFVCIAFVFLLVLAPFAGAYTITEAVPISEYLTELVPGDPDDMLYYEVSKAPIWQLNGLGEAVNSESWVLDIDFTSDSGVEYRDLQLSSSLSGGYIDVSDIMAQADITLSYDVFLELALRGDANVSGVYQFAVKGYDSSGVEVDTVIIELSPLDNSDFNIEYEEEDGPDGIEQVQYLSLALDFEGTYVLPVNTEYIDVLFYYSFDLSGANNGEYDDYWGEWVDGWGEFKTTATPVKFSHALRHVKTDEEREEEIEEEEAKLAQKVQELLDKMNGIDKPDSDELIPEPGTIVDTDMADQIGDCLKLPFTVGIVGEILTAYSVLSLALIVLSYILFGRKS